MQGHHRLTVSEKAPVSDGVPSRSRDSGLCEFDTPARCEDVSRDATKAPAAAEPMAVDVENEGQRAGKQQRVVRVSSGGKEQQQQQQQPEQEQEEEQEQEQEQEVEEFDELVLPLLASSHEHDQREVCPDTRFAEKEQLLEYLEVVSELSLVDAMSACEEEGLLETLLVATGRSGTPSLEAAHATLREHFTALLGRRARCRLPSFAQDGGKNPSCI